MKRNDMHVRHKPTVVAATCVLHNVCEVHGEKFKNSWVQDVIRVGGNSFNPPTNTCRDGIVRGQSKLEMLWYITFLLHSSNKVLYPELLISFDTSLLLSSGT